jgi:hypothetical protein
MKLINLKQSLFVAGLFVVLIIGIGISELKSNPTKYVLDSDCKPNDFLNTARSQFNSERFWSYQASLAEKEINGINFLIRQTAIELTRLTSSMPNDVRYETANLVNLGVTGDNLKKMLQIYIDNKILEIQLKSSLLQRELPAQREVIANCIDKISKHY